MNSIDRDLREALEQLAGDPIADAQRVLAALPPPGPAPEPPGRGLPPLGWWMLGAGLLLGFGAGALMAPGAATALPPARLDPPKVESPKPDKPDDNKPKPDDKKPDKPPPNWPMESEGIAMMAFAPMAIDEPGVGVQEIEARPYRVADGTTFITRNGPAGLYIVQNDVRVRLDVMTRARVQASEVRLEQGRAWIDSGTRLTEIKIATDLVTSRLEGGCATLTREANGVAVVAVTGTVSMRTPQGEAARLEPRQQAWVDAERGISSITQVPFLGTATSWMTRMILQEQDDTELRQRVKDMVAAYEDGAYRQAAEREIRKLGSHCVPLLAYGIEQHLGHGDDYARQAAQLVAQTVDFLRAGYVLPLLQSDDAEVRVSIFDGLRRAAGQDLGQTEESWRQAPAERRKLGAEAWEQALAK
jgi:hypothetical protein